MFTAIKQFARQTYNNISIRKLALYVFSAWLIFTVVPSFALLSGVASSLKFLLALAVAPFIFEATVLFFGFANRPILGLGGPTEAQLTQDIMANRNVDGVIATINQNNLPEALIRLGLSALTNPDAQIFNAIVARLAALDPNHLTQRDSVLLRAAVYHRRAECVAVLLRHNSVRDRANDRENQALKEACINGNLEILQDLLTVNSVTDDLTNNHCEALRLAVRYDHIGLAASLLRYPAVQDYTIPEGVVIESPRNEADFTNIPPVEVPVAPQQPRSIFTIFAQIGNLVEPRNRGGQNVRNTDDLYINEQRDNELRYMAGYGENSMMGPTPRQQKAVDDMKERYRAAFTLKGEDAIYEEIKTHLRGEYERNPVSRHGYTLPIDGPTWHRLLLGATHADYYQHTVHAAYRYLFLVPNPWKAPYGRPNQLTNASKTNIAYMWLAVTDTTRPLPEGQTREGLFAEFAQTIFYLCRAHNFDNSRTVSKTRRNPRTGLDEIVQVQEEYDDMEGDKGTCPQGADQRIHQFNMVFINDRPETRSLNEGVMRTRFKEQMMTESTFAGAMYPKLQAMDTPTLTKLREAVESAWVVGDAVTTETQAMLDLIAFTEEDIDAFIEDCKKYYAPSRITQDTPLTLANVSGSVSFQSYEALIRYYGKQGSPIFCEDILRNIEQILDSRKPKPSDGPSDTLAGSNVLRLSVPNTDAKNSTNANSGTSPTPTRGIRLK